MCTMEQCARIAGLAPDDLSLCAVPAAKHKSLLDSYRANLKRGSESVCRMIVRISGAFETSERNSRLRNCFFPLTRRAQAR